MNIINKLLIHTIRNLIGLFLIFSAYSKLFPIEHFELYIFSHTYIGFNLASAIAVLIISVELTLGVLLLLNVYTKKVIFINILLLAIFSLYLIYLLIIGNNENCHCLGAEFKLNPLESLLKNIIILGLSILLYYKNISWCFRLSKIIFILLLLLSFSIPVILMPPDFLFQKRFSNNYAKEFDISLIENKEYNNPKIEFSKGKKIICFFSMKCKYCKLAAKKISIISDKIEYENDILYIFYGKEENISSFWEESQSKKFPYLVIPFDDFFKISGSRVPSIFYTENGKMIKNIGYRSINQKEIENFLKPK